MKCIITCLFAFLGIGIVLYCILSHFQPSKANVNDTFDPDTFDPDTFDPDTSNPDTSNPDTSDPGTFYPVTSDSELATRREFIENMTREAWNAYYKHSWGDAFLRPLSYNESIANATKTGQTIVQSLTTLWLLKMKHEFAQAKHWIIHDMNLSYSGVWALEPLLSTFFLTGDKVFSQKAQEIIKIHDQQIKWYDYSYTSFAFDYLGYMTGRRECFKERYAIDLDDSRNYNYFTHFRKMHPKSWLDYQAIEKGAVKTPDCRYLTHFLHNIKNYRKPYELSQNLPHLFPGIYESYGLTYITTTALNTMNQLDCVYGALTGRAYLASSNHCHSTLIEYYSRWYAEINENYIAGPKQVEESLQTLKKSILFLGTRLTETCHFAAHSTNTFKLPPGQMNFGASTSTENRPVSLGADESYRLSPHLAKSYLVLYQITKDEKYRNYAWELAQAIQQHCRTATGGYVGIEKLSDANSAKIDEQPAEFLGATLKYLYMIFAPADYLPSDKWFFNADGQPLPICGRNPVFQHC